VPSWQAEDENALIASGTIRTREIRIAPELGGRIERVEVETGDAVKAGDVLIQLDTTPWELELLPAEAAVETAEAELAATMAGPRPEEIEGAAAALALAKAERDGAYEAWQVALDVLEDPQDLDAQLVDAKTQVALAAQGVELAEAELQAVQLRRDQTRAGTPERASADYQVVAAREALEAAEADETTAQVLLNTLWAIRREPLGLIAQAQAAEGAFRAAEAGVAVAEARRDDLLAGPMPEDIAMDRAALNQAQAKVDLLKLRIARGTLTSPVDGTVIARVLDVGELAGPAMTILTVADLSEVRLDVYVAENRIGRIRLEQQVEVSVDSFPDRTFGGRVIRIEDEPEYTPRNVATKEERLNTFYAVEIRLSNPEGLLKPGMPADAQFLAGTASD
jgi:multidrug resistance efflux pump